MADSEQQPSGSMGACFVSDSTLDAGICRKKAGAPSSAPVVLNWQPLGEHPGTLQMKERGPACRSQVVDSGAAPRLAALKCTASFSPPPTALQAQPPALRPAPPIPPADHSSSSLPLGDR